MDGGEEREEGEGEGGGGGRSGRVSVSSYWAISKRRKGKKKIPPPLERSAVGRGGECVFKKEVTGKRLECLSAPHDRLLFGLKGERLRRAARECVFLQWL